MIPASTKESLLELAATRYETLRAAALGEAVPPEYRSGLALFLRRGMWGWAQLGAMPPVQPPRSAGFTYPRPQSTIIHVFAAMAQLPINERAR